MDIRFPSFPLSFESFFRQLLGYTGGDLDFQGFAFVAQWIEQEPSNLLVAGSIPAEGALAKVGSGYGRLGARSGS